MSVVTTTNHPTSTSQPDSLLRLAFELPENPAYIVPLRRTVRGFLEELGAPRRDAEDVELMLGELTANVVQHAHSGSYRVLLECFADRVLIAVSDTGEGFSLNTLSCDPGSPGTARTKIFEDQVGSDTTERFGGFGLPLVHFIADRVEVLPNEPSGTTVRAEKILQWQTATERHEDWQRA